MNEQDKWLKAKIACPETGIEIRHTLCDICAPGHHCGVDAYVKDGVVIKVEGTPEHPVNHGKLCTKGCSNRQYVYRKDRIRTPLRRVGERGEGRFEEISWEEAYRDIASRLNGIKENDGAEAVAFFSGYAKWYRPMYQRFAYSFGSLSYGTESSACYTSRVIAWKVATGRIAAPDTGKTKLFLGWAFNPYYTKYLNAAKLAKQKEEGLKIIIVDPRITPATQKMADLHLRPRVGTDGALAHAIANELIRRGWIDREYIESYVYGFEEYSGYVSGFNESNIEALTGVPYELVVKAAAMLREAGTFCVNESSSPLAHHKNGLQNYRAIMALTAITGNYDRAGGQMPNQVSYVDCCAGYPTRERDFIDQVKPVHAKLPVGADRFPLWYEIEGDMQSMDLSRQILEETPYPIKAVFALGMNMRMFPDTSATSRALEKVDFFVNTDLFMTDTCQYADIVLPACSSFERGEFKPYPKGYAFYTKPVIEPLYQAKNDVQILSELAREMKLGDELLEQGYEACVRYILKDLPLTVDQLKAEEFPVKVPGLKPGTPGAYIAGGCDTVTGKFELKSALLEQHLEWGLDPLPTYTPPQEKTEEYPYALCAGARLPNALHSRLHDVPWLRSMRPDPTADISLEDAKELGIKKGDDIELYTGNGAITVKANPTVMVLKGTVHMYHGYREADVNCLMDYNALDAYSGFPAYRSIRCGLRKRVTE